ncbi:MAG: type III secretion system export apparatus subunit SctS [Deltaproteobacteria bacterium]|nr:type III secretion system export apparatus subunit SctS [Deltaproteobacteria bacterium]
MVQDFILKVANEAILLVLVISAPPVLLSLLVGLIIALFQAVTQVQEQTLTFVPKVLVVFGTLAIMGPTLGAAMAEFGRICFEGFATVVGH